MRTSHGKDVGGAIDQGGSKWLAAQPPNVNAFLLADLNCIKARRLPAHRMHSSRGYFDVSSVSEQTAKKTFRNRTAANVTCADKENVFHDFGSASARDSNLELNLSKSISCRGSNSKQDGGFLWAIHRRIRANWRFSTVSIVAMIDYGFLQ
jgi:hypothetical protein